MDHERLSRTVAHARRHEPWVYRGNERVWLADALAPRCLERDP